MRDTWNGSGVGSVEMTREFICRDCSWEGELEGSTDDNKYVLYAECPNCKQMLEFDLDAERQHEKYFGDN